MFNQILVPRSVVSELGKAQINTDGFKNSVVVKLTRDELLSLKKMDSRLGWGERECLAIARYRNVPLASNDKLVHLTCKEQEVDYFTLPRLLRFAILRNLINREEARKLVVLIEREERTVIKESKEIFK
ncbi:MAG: hypothetical protein JRN52_11000 [Nitrososphaerota archaeon]|nr:hypothetical protein [Nitrososphaerota archaeon]